MTPELIAVLERISRGHISIVRRSDDGSSTIDGAAASDVPAILAAIADGLVEERQAGRAERGVKRHPLGLTSAGSRAVIASRFKLDGD